MFGEIVRTCRLRRGLTQEELAEHAGVALRTIRNLENERISRPRTATVRLLARVFELQGADREAFQRAAMFCADPTAESGGGPAQSADATQPAVAPEPAGTPTRTTAVPAQLPADVAGFTGRVEHLDRLNALIDGAPSSTVLISAIAGTAGVGKTALAVHWAHQVADRFPDGQLYVNLRGYDPHGRTMEPGEVVRGFLDALGVPAARIPEQVSAQVALYRSQLAGRRMLILLDNARDAEQVRPLLPATPGCLAIVTSRNTLGGLIATESAQPLSLDVLDHDEARELLTRRLGADRCGAEPQARDQIITTCARLPLALSIVAARAQQTGFPLAQLAAELSSSTQVLDALDAGDPLSQIRTVFSWSYATLTEPAARLFRLLGLHPGPDTSRAAAASLAGRSIREIRPLLAELTWASLLAEHSPGRYSFHDLLRAYASELAETFDGGQRDAAVHRILDHYLQTAHRAATLLAPRRDKVDPPATSDLVSPEVLADQQQAMAWFIAEHPVLLAAIGQATAARLHTHTWLLAWTLNDFLRLRGHWHDSLIIQHTALAAVDWSEDRSGQAMIRRELGVAYARLGRHREAERPFQEALRIYTELGDHNGLAWTYSKMAWSAEQAGRSEAALQHALRALDLFEATGDRRGRAQALNGSGWYYCQVGQAEKALEHCRQALAPLREIGDQVGEANTLDSIGYAHHHLGQHDAAVSCYEQALELFRTNGARWDEADTLVHLGDSQHAAGRTELARTAWLGALAILDELGHSDTEPVRAKLLALRRTGPPTRPSASSGRLS